MTTTTSSIEIQEQGIYLSKIGDTESLITLLQQPELFDPAKLQAWSKSLPPRFETLPPPRPRYELELIRTAADHGRADTLRYLLARGLPWATLGPIFFRSIRSGNPDAIQVLLDKDPTLIHSLDLYGTTALKQSLCKKPGSPNSVFKFLLAKGADPTKSDLMSTAVGTFNIEAVDILESYGVGPDKKNLLVSAVGSRDIDVVKWLVEAGAPVADPTPGSSNYKALHIAVENSHMDETFHLPHDQDSMFRIAEYLLEHGADPLRIACVSKRFGETTAIRLAELRNQTDMVELFRNHIQTKRLTGEEESG